MNKQKLKIARNKIDYIDGKIFNLIKKRTKLVIKMLKLKNFKSEIIDHKRINEILKNIKKRSIKNHIDPKITRKIWKSIIWSYVDFQKKKVGLWYNLFYSKFLSVVRVFLDIVLPIIAICLYSLLKYKKTKVFEKKIIQFERYPICFLMQFVIFHFRLKHSQTSQKHVNNFSNSK